MDLYDDIDTKPRNSQIDGWSSGIKMLQTQLAIKKAQVPKEQTKKPLMTPVMNLRTKKSFGDEVTHTMRSTDSQKPPLIITTQLLAPMDNVKTDDWDFVDEYDPQWPNEYEKLKERQNSTKDKGRDERGRNGSKRRARSSHANNPRDSPPVKFSGMGQRANEEESYSPPTPGSVSSKGGATIAPPPSLQEISIESGGDGSSNVQIPYTSGSVAAKIMAKYGFKDGQGLGKQEQGMSMALQVEKTSKRGGRIIHEKDVFLPPPPLGMASPPSGNAMPPPPSTPPIMPPRVPTPPPNAAAAVTTEPPSSEPSITEIMKQPSKVVLLRNMVGPGDVDEELEPEVKDECNTKYGEVISVVIHEAFGTIPEDAVKIYVEFKRIESAIKAVVDLNGRFFGGRQVRAGFYNFDKFKSFQLH